MQLDMTILMRNFQLPDMNLKIKYQLDKNLNVKKKNQLKSQTKKANKNCLDLS